MPYKLIAAAAFITLILLGCSKEMSLENGVVPGPPVPPPVPGVIDSNYLSKIYSLNVTATSSDTVLVRTYNYDGLKRLVSLIDTSNDLYEAQQVRAYYSYNGADTLPYKSVEYIESGMVPGGPAMQFDTATAFHYYDATGRNIKDSVIHSHHQLLLGTYAKVYTIKSYSYAPGKVYGYQTSVLINSNNSYLPPNQKDTADVNAAGNITSNKRYVYDAFSATWHLTATSAFVYDTHVNPFALLSNYKTYGVFPDGETLIFWFPQKNNRLEQHELHSIPPGGGPGGTNIDWTYTYTYRPNGLVNTMKLLYDPSIPSEYYQLLYRYKAL